MLSCGLVRLSLWCGLEWSLGEVGAQTRVHHTWMGSGPQGDMQRFMNPDAYKEGREIWTGKQVCALPSGAYSHPLLVSAHICMGCLSSVSSVLSRVQLFATHGLQDARPRCPSPTPGVYSNSCPLSWWCHPTISSSHHLIPSPPAFNLSHHQGLFKWVGSLHQVAKVLEFQLQHQSFQWIFRTDFL